jgi:hypothetical protein
MSTLYLTRGSETVGSVTLTIDYESVQNLAFADLCARWLGLGEPMALVLGG